MAVTKISIIGWQDTLGTHSHKAFKHRDTALKFSTKMLEEGYNVSLSELEYDDGIDLNVCVDNTVGIGTGPVAAG
jgi:hypothetical protein